MIYLQQHAIITIMKKGTILKWEPKPKSIIENLYWVYALGYDKLGDSVGFKYVNNHTTQEKWYAADQAHLKCSADEHVLQFYRLYTDIFAED